MKMPRQSLFERYKRMYDPMYTFSLCREDEVDEVAAFIDSYWKKGHALVKSRRLMDWQYRDAKNHAYHFVIARSRETGEIHALEGFIPTTQFDGRIATPMTWGAIWKTVPDVAPPGLGFVVKQFRETAFATEYACEIGISPDAGKYNAQFGHTVYSLGNWYFVNPSIKDYRLIETSSVPMAGERRFPRTVKADGIGLQDWDAAAAGLAIPAFKSVRYYANRYFTHPFYRYRALLLEDNEEGGREIMFYRVAEHGGRNCIFIVDFVGDASVLAKSGAVLLDLVEEHNAEYILFPCHGLDARLLRKAGFANRNDTDAIVPLYYEPFLKRNVDIVCASKRPSIKWCSFKGDADQDRPNLV